MNKSKSSLIFHINQTESNNTNNNCIKSSTSDLYNSTLPNIRNNLFTGFFYESYVEKYNEKINIWQKSYLCVKKNYICLYDKKPKLLDKPKEFLFLNNKITLTFHKKLLKLKAIKCFVINIKINNEALSKSLIEDNKHNLYISFKTEKNYDNFIKVVDNILKCKQYTNSVSPNQMGIRITKKEKNIKNDNKENNEKKLIKKNVSTDKKMTKSLTSFHIKNKSVNEISINKSLIFSGCKETNDDIKSKSKNKENNNKDNIDNKDSISKDNCQNSNNNININNNNSNNKITNSFHNVFTFSKVENLSNNTNDKKINNSNSTNKSNSNNHLKRINNVSINEKNRIFLEKNLVNNIKRNINFFTVNFTEHNSRQKNNNIFDTDESILTEKRKAIYSIKRKKLKEKEDILNVKRQRTKSCYGFKLNNIFLKNEEKDGNKIIVKKIKLKDFNSFCHQNHNRNKKINFNISNYSRDEKNISLNINSENQENSDTTNVSITQQKVSVLSNIKEEEKNNTGSKSRNKNDNSNNNNINMSFGSLKSFKSESKEENNTNNNNDYFDGLNIYSYVDVDASETIKNKSTVEDSNPLSSINVPNIRNQITKIIKQNEEMISQQNNNNENDNSDVIFTPRLMEEIQQQEIITVPNSNNIKDKNDKNNDDKKDDNDINNKKIESNSKTEKIELSSNKNISNIINTSITRCKKNMTISNDLNEIIQSLETKNHNKSHNNNQSIHSYNEINDLNDIELSNTNSHKNSNKKEEDKNDINDIAGKILENSFAYSNKSIKIEETNTSNCISNANANYKLSIPFNTFFNVNLSFYFMDFNFNFLTNDKSCIKELITKIDNNLLFIYDSNILNLLLKKIKATIQYEASFMSNDIEGKITKNKILGKIYEYLNNKYVKYFILCEMIAIISKKELSKLIITSIEINNKKKEINPNESNINFDEYIYDTFNKYLSRNENNKDYINLYENILPKEIKKVFDINDSEGSLLSIIKQNIHPYTLFNSMQYHNKLYININLDNNDFFNFNSLKPFNKSNSYYISPYILEKWKYKASLTDNKGNNIKNENNNINDTNTSNASNYIIDNTNPINESFDSNGNYSKDISNTSLSCIVFDKNNKFRVSLISRSNDSIINSFNNNLYSGLVKKEKNIYEEYKLYEKTEEMQKINLFQNIILNINKNEYNSALKNCEYLLQKYQNSTLFLHPLIYLCLAFIHNKIDGFHSAQKYIKKSLKYLTWLYPYQNCFLFYEIEYKYLLIILNNEENIIRNNIENISNIFAQCDNLWKKYYEDKKNPELKINEIIFKIYFKITDDERNNSNFLNNLFYNNIKPLMNELEQKKQACKEKRDKGTEVYWKLFIEFFKNCPGSGIMVFNDLIRSVSFADN